MKESPLRNHAMLIERIKENGVTKFKYKHSPVFTDLKECVQWIYEHIEEFDRAD